MRHANGPGYRGVCWWIILALVLFVTVARFVDLEKSPPGFYIDEAINGAQAVCLARTGHDVNGVRYPLFAECAGGGLCSPTHLYLASIWVLIFGDSIGALRAMSALVMSLAIIGLFFFSRVFLGGRGAMYVAWAACLSPWLFQFARMAVDSPSLMLLGLTWGMYFFIRSARRIDGLLAALFFSISMYSYPPARAVIPMVFVTLLLLKNRVRGFNRGFLISFCACTLFFCGPLIWLTLRGGMSLRYGIVGILAPSFIERLPHQAWYDLIPVFIDNVLTHLQWRYLFIQGDPNLRHSTQFVGELSWLDSAALILGLALWIFQSIKNKAWRFDKLCLFALAGFIVGIVPAALTWEGLPHSLRSLASWLFACLLTGTIIWRLEQSWPKLMILFVTVALSFTFFFGQNYFFVYPRMAPLWFDAAVKEAALRAQGSGDWESFVRKFKEYDGRAIRYYLIHYAGQTCDESRLFLMRRTSP